MPEESIRLKCRCGAEFSMYLNTYINAGGRPDGSGRVFIAELRAEEWLDRHQACLQQNAN